MADPEARQPMRKPIWFVKFPQGPPTSTDFQRMADALNEARRKPDTGQDNPDSTVKAR